VAGSWEGRATGIRTLKSYQVKGNEEGRKGTWSSGEAPWKVKTEKRTKAKLRHKQPTLREPYPPKVLMPRREKRLWKELGRGREKKGSGKTVGEQQGLEEKKKCGESQKIGDYFMLRKR